MGLDRLRLLCVTAAAALCLLRTSQGSESLVRARVGGAAELGCSLAPPSSGATTPRLFPLHVVEWVRLGYNVPILIKFGVYSPRVHPSYRGRVSLTRGASLLVEGLRLDDEGWFECRILLLDRTTDEFRNGTWTFLSITAPPVFFKTPPPFLEALQGSAVSLTCGAHGNPQPTVTWQKDDAPIEKQDNVKVLNGTLSLATVTREMGGMYKCHASNSEGNLSHSTQLLIKGPPIIIIPPEDVTLNMSQDGILQCQAEAYPTNLTYVWQKQGENVHHIESLKTRVKILVDGTLLIPRLLPEDAGNYTCMPTNGLLTPPTASAYLTVKHPAQVVRMPRETYLPTGMGGVITCPVRAEPPMLFVNWTKDGDNLDLNMFPGWMVNSEGSVFIATANDDAVGMYTCTAYNSYGTMGQSEPTKVVLEDPPSFQVSPRAEYLQEVGRDLVIPCQGRGDPSPNVTWSKVGPLPRSPYTVAANGSLVLRPLKKDHQGAWECHVTNRVATISTSTIVLVLGTSPHAVSSVSVIPEMNQANVSWEPGFDGGYTQKFSVWLRQASRGKHEWTSLLVPTSKSHLLVTGLLPGTSYQFSILPQNKLGSGPFSEITTIRTLVPPTDPPMIVTTIPKLAPPSSLSANRSSEGIVLTWELPLSKSPPITAFVLQARRERGEWSILNGAIGANKTEILVEGLLKDTVYELRMLSRRNKLVSEPSESVNISTAGMEVYPVRTSLLEFVPEPLLAGVVGGVCFLFVAIILSLLTACIMSHRRDQRRRKRRDDLPTALQKSPPTEAGSPTDSPDSVLKLKLCPPLSFFPNSSSSQSDRSSFDKASRSEYQDQRRQLLSSSSPPPHYTLFESHLGGTSSPTSALESISRGPDGRFIVQPYDKSSTPSNIKISLKKDFPQCSAGGDSSTGSSRASYRGSPKSDSLDSESAEKKNPSPVLTVDLPGPSKISHSPGRVKAMARNFSRHGCFYSDDEQGCSEALLERASFYSDSSEKRDYDPLKKYRMSVHPEGVFPSLNRKTREAERERLQPSLESESQLTNTSTLVSQMEHERERDNLSKCLQLAREREEMERELERYTASQRVREADTTGSRRERKAQAEEPIWKLQDVTLRQKAHHISGQAQRMSDYRRGCYFGNTSSPMGRTSSSSYIHWDISPVTSVTSLVPLQSPLENITQRSQQPCSPPAGAATRDSVIVDCSRSPVTQCTSLSLLSPTTHSLPLLSGGLCGTKTRYPERSLPEEDWRAQREGLEGTFFSVGANERVSSPDQGAFVSRSSLNYNVRKIDPGLEPAGESNVHCAEMDKVRALSPSHSHDESSPHHPPKREGGKDSSVEQEMQSHTEGATLPYEHRKSTERGKDKQRESKTRDSTGSPLLSPEFEKECVRARSRKSDKCLYSSSPSYGSPLTLLENESDSDQSNYSVARMSDSLKPRLVMQPSKISLLQTSAILEYLSLPGFIEMSVDEPVDEAADPAWPSIDERSENLLQGGLDMVSKDWETQDSETKSSPKNAEDRPLGSQSADSGPSEGLECRHSSVLDTRERSLKVRASNKNIKRSLRSESETEQSYHLELQPLLPDKTPSSGLEAQLARTDLSQTLVHTAKDVADVLSRAPECFTSRQEPALEQSQRLDTQGNRTNRISSRIYQAPMPFMKKSLSLGPSGTLSVMGPPRPHLKKSISLGSQRWEHYESPRNYVSEKCYRDEFPNPDVRIKSFSLGRTSAYPFSSRPGPFWRGSATFRPQSTRSLESPPCPERSSVTPPRLAPLPPPMEPLRHPEASASTRRQSSDPRRQATAFPDSSRWPMTYQEALRSVQHKSVPRDPSQFQVFPRQLMRVEYPRPLESKRGPPRAFLPRGYSWPSPYHSPFPPREPEGGRQRERESGKGAEVEIRDCRDGKEGRASYASQSSGRGSVGPSYTHAFLRQSLSLTPTLPSSPETTEESEMHKAEMELQSRRLAKRRNTSVDESYEWDATDLAVESEFLEATKTDYAQEGVGKGRGERRYRPCSTAGLRDPRSKGLFPSVSPPLSTPPRGLYARSLSEARFNALRQEYQEYRRTQESICSRDPCLSPDPDLDPNTALL
ncbi:protein turtle homolog A isoform X1 [Anguilla anguilla]|uniref:protein turtle homolog A isoform X1 n=1 Tax=Anguilla anguilla TaxID=7936 RepID=UPI0015A9100A|nr:protein turtle homolog A isoform X1 [Anguilla anguilla]